MSKIYKRYSIIITSFFKALIKTIKMVWKYRNDSDKLWEIFRPNQVEIRIKIKGYKFKISLSNSFVDKIKTKKQAQEWAIKYIYDNIRRGL